MEEMTSTAEMFRRNLNHQADSSNKKNFGITPDEARKAGLSFRKQPPPDDVCQFCGKKNARRGIVLGNEVVIWQPFISRCSCKEAQKYWAEYDRREKEKQEQEKIAKERQKKQDKIDRLLGKSGIKKRFRKRTFEDFVCDTPQRRKCYQIAKQYADTFSQHYKKGEGLFIEGTNGTGKTHLAVAIALQLINDGIPVICKTSSDLLLDIKKTFNNDTVSEAAVLNIYKVADLLIIDDLGKEQCSDWSMSTLYSILNDRYEDMKPTIVTTNYNTEQLINALTPKGYDNTKIIAIISRLKETSTVMTMAWQDCRGR